MYRLIILLLSLIFSLNIMARELVVFLKESPSGTSLMLLDTKTKIETKVEIDNYTVIYPTISADGKLLAFSGSLNNKDWGIFVYEISTKEIVKVVSPSGLTIQPSFSGNNRYLAYTAPVNKKNQIHILDYNKWKSSSQTKAKIVTTKLPAYYPFLSSGGFKVVFHLSNLVNGKRVQNIAEFDTKKEKLIEFKSENGNLVLGKSPCLSLDDSKIAFVVPKGDDKWAIREFDIENKKLVDITKGNYKDYSPRYFGDGRLLFSSNRSGVFKFYTLNLQVDTGSRAKPTILHNSNTNIWDPRVSGNINYKQTLYKSIGGEKRSSFGAVSVGTSIYVVGGHKGFEHTYPPESFSREVFRYDLGTNKWTQLADKVSPVHGVTISHHRGFLYAFGGFAYSAKSNPKWKSLKTIERYNIAQNKWEVIGDLPEPRSSNAIAVIGSKVYLIGGWNATPKHAGDRDGVFHKSIVIFDMVKESSSYASFVVPAKARRAFTATTRAGRIIIGGGITQGGRHFDMLDEVWSINPAINSNWTKLPKLPFANFAPAMINLNGSLFMFGGMKLTKSGYEYVNHVYKLDDTQNNWIHTGRFLSERKGFIQPVLINNQAGLLGGHTYDYIGKDGPVSTFEAFR
jgi:hypothetical protein